MTTQRVYGIRNLAICCMEKVSAGETKRETNILPLLKEEEMAFQRNHGCKNTWFIWDPCGIACAVATYIFLVYGELVLLLVIAPPFPDVWTLCACSIFTALVALAISSHVKAMTTDPVRGIN